MVYFAASRSSRTVRALPSIRFIRALSVVLHDVAVGLLEQLLVRVELVLEEGSAKRLLHLAFTGLDPGVDLGELELPEATDLVGGHTLRLDPPIDRVLHDPQVFRYVVD